VDYTHNNSVNSIDISQAPTLNYPGFNNNRPSYLFTVSRCKKGTFGYGDINAVQPIFFDAQGNFIKDQPFGQAQMPAGFSGPNTYAALGLSYDSSSNKYTCAVYTRPPLNAPPSPVKVPPGGPAHGTGG
jgi:hypothetical protein